MQVERPLVFGFLHIIRLWSLCKHHFDIKAVMEQFLTPLFTVRYYYYCIICYEHMFFFCGKSGCSEAVKCMLME